MKTQQTVRNCKDDFAFVCPKLWDKLEPTANPSVRFCNGCKETVYLCRTDEETLRRARDGQCIARERPDESERTPMVVGRPKMPPVPTASQLQAEEWATRERGIDKSLGDLKYSHRSCPECGYPSPDWRPACPVCNHHLGRV
jgi:hypothetical protein